MRILLFLLFLLLSLISTNCYASIIAQEVNAEHTLVQASKENPESWLVFTWQNNKYVVIKHVVTKDGRCVFTGPPGKYLIVNGTDFFETIIGKSDNPVKISANNIKVTESDSLVPANFSVTLNQQYNKEVIVKYSTEAGTADESDFKPVSGELIFKPGETQKFVTVEILGDKVEEPNETFSIKLSSDLQVENDGVCTIIDNDNVEPDPEPTPIGFEQSVFELASKINDKNILRKLAGNYDSVAIEADATNMTVDQMINLTKSLNNNVKDADKIKDSFFQPLAVLILNEGLAHNDKPGHIKLWEMIAKALRRI